MTPTGQIVPLVKLPPSDWRLKALASPHHVGVSVYSRPVDGRFVRVWQRWSIFDFPNDLFGIVDLEKAGLLGPYLAAVHQAEMRSATAALDGTLQRTELNDVGPDYDLVTPPVRSLRRKALDLLQAILPTRFAR